MGIKGVAFWVVAVLMVLVTACGAWAYIPEEVALYRFNDSTDSSPSGFDLTNNGAIAFTTNSEVNGRNANITIGQYFSQSSLDLVGKNRTVYCLASPSGATLRFTMLHDYVGGNGIFFRTVMAGATGTLSAYHCSGGPCVGVESPVVTTVGEWQWMGYTYDTVSDNLSVWHNGVVVASDTETDSGVSGADSIIGYDVANSVASQGNISACFFYEDVLNETAILALNASDTEDNLSVLLASPPGLISFSEIHNNASLSVAGDVVNFSTVVSAGVGTLDDCWFTHNDSGSWVNETVAPCSPSPFSFSANLTITALPFENVCGFFGANLTNGSQALSSYSCFDVSTTDSLFNVTAFYRNGTAIEVFNVTFYNGTGYNFSKTDSGLVSVYFGAGHYNLSVNTSAGFAFFPYVFDGAGNVSVVIPNMSVVVIPPAVVLELGEVEFSLSVSAVDDVQLSGLGLVYNGTNYSVVRTVAGGVVWYNLTMNIPDIPGLFDNVTYFWNYSLGGSLWSTEEYHVGVYGISFTSCQTPIAGNTTLNFSVYNEDIPLDNMSVDLEVTFSIWNSSRDEAINLSFEVDDAYSFFFCINPNSVKLHTDAYFKYTETDGFTHRYYLVNYPLSNVTSRVSAYNFNYTTGLSDLKATLRYASTYQFFPGVYAQLQRFYVGSNVWRTVQMDRSGAFGLTLFNIKEETTDYRLIFSDGDGNILKQTESSKFLCTDALCEVTVLINPYSAVLSDANPYITSSFDNVTGVLTVDWVDVTGATNVVRVRASKETMSETIEICDESVTSSSGSITCNASAYTGRMFVQVFVTDSAGVESEFSDWVSLGGADLSAQIGNLEGAVWSAGLIITVIGFGLWSPVAGAVSLAFALIVIAVLGIFGILTVTLVLLGGVISIIIGLLVRR